MMLMYKDFQAKTLVVALSTLCGITFSPFLSAELPLAQHQRVVVNNGTEPESLDPQRVSGVPEAAILRQIYEGLTTTDNDGNTIPGIAESWESDDNQTWIFHLRESQWSNGDPVTADDFVYSFKRLVDPALASPYSSYLGDVRVLNAEAIVNGEMPVDSLGVEALDPQTLKITLTAPVPYFPDTLVHTSVKPVHQKTVETFGDKWTSPNNIVSNGPYLLKEWHVNDQILLARNPRYYNNENTIIDEVVILPITSAITGVNRYKANEVDVTSVPPEQFQLLKKEYSEEVKISPRLCTFYFEFNTQKAPFDDVRVRKALSLALNREVITEKVINQGQIPAYQFSPVGINGVDSNTPEWKSWSQEQRNEEAKRLLNEAGYNKDHKLHFELLYSTGETGKKLAVAASSLLKSAIGFVDVDIVNQEWKTYLDTRRLGQSQLAGSGWCADYNEASTFLNMLKSNNGNNYGRYSNTEFDKTINATLASGLSEEERRTLYNKAEAILDEDQPLLNLYYSVNVLLVKPYIDNFSTKDPTSSWQAKYWKIVQHD